VYTAGPQNVKHQQNYNEHDRNNNVQQVKQST